MRVFRQEDLDDFVANITKQVFCSDENISLLADKVLEAQEQLNKADNVLKMLKSRLCETEKSLTNVMNAIEQGVITRTTKERLAALENEKDDIEAKIAVEEMRQAKCYSKAEIEKFLRKEFKNNTQAYLQHIIDKVIVYDDKIEIYYKYTNNRPDDSQDERRGCFSSECKIKINKAKRSMQILHISIDRTIHFQLPYAINRRHKITFDLDTPSR